jgi:hypothetical protein
MSIDAAKCRPADRRVTSLWTAAGFLYIMIAIQLSVFVQTVNMHRM